MPAPGSPTYSGAAKVAAHTAFRDAVDSGSGAGTIKIYDAADVLLATITLTDPCGTVNGTTGQLTLTASGAATAVATGTAAWCTITNSSGTVYLSLDAQAGTSAVSGKIVLNSLSIISGGAVSLVSATIG